mmetsp:Transcript_17764/g.25083  ORF Transcript_17764/g.25083 Transcript_17764/m.25083 type:complete len:600 (+) Transcript_17764:249-2048(+)|eukprot:CAMPEP_0184865754 /NCGR_PEP_ID=MMETSP0580-20130426/18926_1 /TAXON_ID=1118495 /ORGANISM="Dactyliosolen fragilissimus" /LENGTH=599 /DNA_ID=CAMNT_0027365063 /DNA_START=188 /DNA_END=1987 /DNA_ORIENTATION=-
MASSAHEKEKDKDFQCHQSNDASYDDGNGKTIISSRVFEENTATAALSHIALTPPKVSSESRKVMATENQDKSTNESNDSDTDNELLIDIVKTKRKSIDRGKKRKSKKMTENTKIASEIKHSSKDVSNGNYINLGKILPSRPLTPQERTKRGKAGLKKGTKLDTTTRVFRNFFPMGASRYGELPPKPIEPSPSSFATHPTLFLSAPTIPLPPQYFEQIGKDDKRTKGEKLLQPSLLRIVSRMFRQHADLFLKQASLLDRIAANPNTKNIEKWDIDNFMSHRSDSLEIEIKNDRAVDLAKNTYEGMIHIRNRLDCLQNIVMNKIPSNNIDIAMESDASINEQKSGNDEESNVSLQNKKNPIENLSFVLEDKCFKMQHDQEKITHSTNRISNKHSCSHNKNVDNANEEDGTNHLLQEFKSIRRNLDKEPYSDDEDSVRLELIESIREGRANRKRKRENTDILDSTKCFTKKKSNNMLRERDELDSSSSSDRNIQVKDKPDIDVKKNNISIDSHLKPKLIQNSYSFLSPSSSSSSSNTSSSSNPSNNEINKCDTPSPQKKAALTRSDDDESDTKDQTTLPDKADTKENETLSVESSHDYFEI